MPWGTPSALAQPMNAVLVPPGIRAGDVFNLQLPTGESRDVTCPHGACEGQLLQVWRLIPSVDAPPADPDAVLAKHWVNPEWRGDGSRAGRHPRALT